MAKRILIKLKDFQKFWPSASESTTLIECHDGVCHLPMGGGDVPLSTKFVFDFNDEQYVVHSAFIADVIAYHMEKI